LSVSQYNRDFLLKGAVLFVLWENQPHRPTKDIDLGVLYRRITTLGSRRRPIGLRDILIFHFPQRAG
jgi:hypothetical protein